MCLLKPERRFKFEK